VSYTLPNFNLTVNVFTFPGTTVLRLSTQGNLAWGRRVNVASTGGTTIVGDPLMTMTVLLPPLTDVRGPLNAPGPDTLEIPAGSGRYYSVFFVDDIGKGFANEHRAAVLQQLIPWPTPIP
jgi:hypothetical protein